MSVEQWTMDCGTLRILIHVLVGYCDAAWAGNAEDRKSTSGGYFFLGNNMVSWFSKKQNNISLSTAEAEYIAAGSCCTQILWISKC
ncbi:unnamed protein product [Rhodiola kirilowii]